MTFLRFACLLLVLTICRADWYHKERAKRSPEPKSSGHETDWSALAQKRLQQNLAKMQNMGVAKNLILFIGDGMGPSTVTAARWHKMGKDKKTKNTKKAHETSIHWEKWPWTGISKTYNTDRLTPDSAGTGTAFSCGEKARRGTLGVNQNVARGDCSTVDANAVESMLHTAIKEGLSGGIVTTTRITHATPSASYAKSPERDWENDADIPEEKKKECPTFKDIAFQLIHTNINKKIQVILGGGRRNFLPTTELDPEYSDKNGSRTDDLNLIEDWKKIHQDMGGKHAFVHNQAEFDSVDHSKVDYLLGLFEPSHMQYEADRSGDKSGEPSLAEMVEKAVKILSKNPRGFFLMAEGGRIDHAHHDTNAFRALSDVIALEEAVAKADELTKEEDTLIVVTADHSHVFTIGGYPDINSDIYDLTHANLDNGPDIAEDDKPYTILSYANGPGWHTHRNFSVRANLSEWEEDEKPKRDNIDFLQDTAVPLDLETHGGEDVAVYSRGPMAHILTGAFEQHFIAHVMRYAACIGQNTDHCKDTNNATTKHLDSLLIAIASIISLMRAL